MDMQNVSNLEIPEGEVRTIHDKDSRLLWGRVHYDTKYKGDTFQQTYSGKNLLNVNFTNDSLSGLTFTNNGDSTITISGKITASYGFNISPASANTLVLSSGKTYTQRLEVISGSLGGLSLVPAYKDSGGTIRYNYFNNNQTVTTTDTMTNYQYNIYWGAATVGDEVNVTIRVWLEEGSDLSSGFEPFVGGTASPNPEFPQDINVVTGEQTVKVTGKNLFNSYIATKPYWQSGTLVVNSDGTFTVSGNTGSNNYFQLNQTLGTLCPNLKVGDTAYLFLDTTNANKRIYIGETWFGGSSKTITQAMLNAAVVIYGGYNQTDTIKIMVTKAPEITYESYQSQDYAVNLQGKNLCNITSISPYNVTASLNDGAINISGTMSSAGNLSVRVNNSSFVFQPNKTYTITFYCTGTITATGAQSYRVIYMSGNAIGSLANNSNVIYTFTPTQETTITGFSFDLANGLTFDNYSVKIQIEENSSSSSYESYYNYEIAKIGTYEDYIYKSGDDWYVHKATNKIQFNGNESVYNLTSFSDIHQFYVTNYQSQIAGLPQTLDVSYSTHFSFAGVLQSYGYANAIFFNKSGGTTISNGNISFSVHTPTTLADFKTWLGNNRPVLYHPLATPADTKIMDATLIGQLNAIHEWLTRYGYYGTVSGNLPMIIDRTNL